MTVIIVAQCNADSPLILVVLGSLGTLFLNIVLPRLFRGVSFVSVLMATLVWLFTAFQMSSFAMSDFVYWFTLPSPTDWNMHCSGRYSS